MNNVFKIVLILIISILVSFNASAQKISKNEKKQRKIDFKILLANIPDTTNYDYYKQEQIEFISKSSGYKNDILLINQFDLHKRITFYDVYNVGKRIYVWMEGLGKPYPNSENMSEYIKCEELVNIYYFTEDYLVFEYKTNLNDIQFNHAVVKKSNYEIRMKILKKSIELQEQIVNQEFQVSYNNVSALSGKCAKNISKRLDFFIVTTDSTDNNLQEEAKKFSIQWMKKNSFFDMPSFYEKELKSKAMNISIDYHNINFELDSIKYYQLDVVSLLNSGILKDSIKSYWGKPFTTSSYSDLRGALYNKNYQNITALDNYNSTELDKMSDVDYWETIIPKDEEFKKFLSERYIKLTFKINVERYMNNSEINNSEFYLSKFAFDRIRGSVCSNKYCKHECNRSLKGTGKMDVRCSLNWEGKQYSSEKYFYSSIDPETLRSDLMNLLTEEFCRKSGVMNNDRKKKEKEDRYKNDLAKKYGLKYAEAAIDGEIIIGMPEDLITIPLRAWNIDSSSEWNGGYWIYCKFKFDTSKRIRISVRDGKVSGISKW